MAFGELQRYIQVLNKDTLIILQEMASSLIGIHFSGPQNLCLLAFFKKNSYI